MLYSELTNNTPQKMCALIGQSIETDIKQKHLKKKDVAAQAGITTMTLHRICTGENVKLENVISVMQVINRFSALQAMVTPLPVEPMSLYKEMVAERNARLMESGNRKARKPKEPVHHVTAADIARLCQ